MSDYKIGSIVPLTDDSKEARFAHALKSLNATAAERDQLRAELAAEREDAAMAASSLANTMADVSAQYTALAGHVERLVGALKGVCKLRKKMEATHQAAYEAMFKLPGRWAFEDAAKAIAATPAQSLAAHDAALLREVADGVDKIAVVAAFDTPNSMRDLIADAIRAKADRIEKEAANG